MNKKRILIPKDALQETVACCHIELVDVLSKTQKKRELLIRFFLIEMIPFFKCSLIGMILCFVFSMIFNQYLHWMIYIYICIMGSLMIMELYKRKYYHTEEIMSAVLINEARVFLIKMTIIAWLEILEMLLLGNILIWMNKISFAEFMLYSWIPLFLLETINIVFVKYIDTMWKAFGIYIISSFIYSVIIEYLEIFIGISKIPIICFSISIILIYFILMIFQFKNNKGGRFCGISS